MSQSIGPYNGGISPSQLRRHEPEYTGITKAKVERAALYALCGVGVGAGVSTLKSDRPLRSIPPFLASLGAFCWARTIKDYGDTRELNKMRAEAEGLSFKEVIAKHGLKNTVTYQILDPEILKHKFSECYKDSVLPDVLKDYPFCVIWDNKLASVDTLRQWLLSGLKKQLFEEVDGKFLRICFLNNLLLDEEFNALRTTLDERGPQLKWLQDEKEKIDLACPKRLSKRMEVLDKEEKGLVEERHARVFNGNDVTSQTARDIALAAQNAMALDSLEDKITAIGQSKKLVEEDSIAIKQQRSYESDIEGLERQYRHVMKELSGLFIRTIESFEKRKYTETT